MTYKEIVTLIKTISEAINPDGSFFHGRTYDTTLEFAAIYPQIHLYPFTMQPEQSNYNIIRSELLIAFWKEDGHENTMAQREDIIAAMDDLCVLFEAAIRATENVQVLSFRKEPQYLSQIGVVSGIACNISLHSAVLCGAPTEQAPVNLTLPLITGLNTLGATLSGSNGTWSGNPDTFTYTYQWKRDGVNISGATNNTYVTTVLDSEAEITFEVTANNGVSPNGVVTALAVTMADYTPVNILAPAISGSTSLGSTLTTTNGSWTNSPSIFSYQWKRNGVNISGATNSTYVTVVADSTAAITCEVTASNGLVASQISNSLVMADYTPVNTVAPAVTGTAVVGQNLTTTDGTWNGTLPITYSYQWYRGAIPIGTNSNTYTLVQADAGNTSNIKCVVTATNSAGSASADSNTIAQILTVRTNSYIVLNSISDVTLIGAINNVDIGIINNSLTNLRGIYFFNAGTADKAKYNLLDQRDLDAAFRITFVNTVGGDFTSNGWLPNGVNSYGNPHFTPSINASINGMGHGVYSRTNNTTGTRIYGCVTASVTILQNNLSGGNFVSGNVTNNIINYTASPTTRFLYNRRNSSTDMQAYRDGTSIGTNTNACAALPSSKFYFGARNGGSGTPDFYDNHQITIGVLDIGLTNAQALILRTIVDNYNLECGINV